MKILKIIQSASDLDLAEFVRDINHCFDVDPLTEPNNLSGSLFEAIKEVEEKMSLVELQKIVHAEAAERFSNQIPKNRTFKVVARSHNHGRQFKKRVYTSKEIFDRHSPEWINRWIRYYDIEIYEQVKGKWELLEKRDSKGEKASWIHNQ